MPDRQAALNSFFNTLSAGERDWLLRQLIGKSRAGRIGRQNAGAALLNAEIRLFNRIGEARTATMRLARIRLWLIFLLLRYGALRPGEAISLPLDSLDTRDGFAQIGGEFARRVFLPLDVARRMGHVLCGLPAARDFLKCDDGQLRRSLRECEKACGIPAGLLSPLSLRKNRARELELSGLPYALLNYFLGRKMRMPGLVADFANPEHILKIHIQEEQSMKTSARNVFQGKVEKIRQNGILAEITLKTASGLEIVAIITESSFKSLALCEGKVLNALVKAPFVSVIPADERAAAGFGAENCFKGTVREIQADEMAEEILVELAQGNTVCSLYARGARPSGRIARDSEAFVCFSAFSVILNED